MKRKNASGTKDACASLHNSRLVQRIDYNAYPGDSALLLAVAKMLLLRNKNTKRQCMRHVVTASHHTPIPAESREDTSVAVAPQRTSATGCQTQPAVAQCIH